MYVHVFCLYEVLCAPLCGIYVSVLAFQWRSMHGMYERGGRHLAQLAKSRAWYPKVLDSKFKPDLFPDIWNLARPMILPWTEEELVAQHCSDRNQDPVPAVPGA